MKRLACFALILAACSEAPTSIETTTPEIAISVPTENVGVIGNWQSLDDDSYMLKISTETYREFYDDEEMSRDQWQPVTSCDEPLPASKETSSYGGFEIRTVPTDDPICYSISELGGGKMSFSYAGSTLIYQRTN